MNNSLRRVVFLAVMFFCCLISTYSENIEGLNFKIYNALNGIWCIFDFEPRKVLQSYSWGNDYSYTDGIVIDFGSKKIEFNGLSYDFTIESVKEMKNDVIKFTGYFSVYDARVEKIIYSPAEFHIKIFKDGKMEFLEDKAGEFNFHLRFSDDPNIRIHKIETSNKRIIIQEPTKLFKLKNSGLIYCLTLETSVKGIIIKEDKNKSFILTEDGNIGWIEKTIGNDASGRINDQWVRIREFPNLECKTLGYFSKDENVKIKKISNKKMKIQNMESFWYYVETDENISGWVYGWFVDIGIN